jgi:CubicO group peptidase (beta-lactamase class C family)
MFRKRELQILITLVIFTLLISTPSHAQDKAHELDEIFSWATSSSPGCTVGVSQNGQVLANRAYGMSDLERGIALTTESVFDVGSVTKQFVAASVLLLVDEGRISLSDAVHKYIPELPDYGHTVTIDHLLTHTSGIRDWVQLSQMTGDREDVLGLILRQSSLDFTPGEAWAYSNSGYELLREIVARVSGQPLAEFMQTRLFVPLGMSSTRYARDALKVPNHALAYEKEGGGWKVDMLLGNARGGGAVFSTASDLLIWNDALTNGRLGTFVSTKLQEPATLANGETLDYARGLMLDNDGEIVWHAGDAAAYNAILARLPKQGLSLALLCNAGEVADDKNHEIDIIKLYASPTSTETSDAAGTASSRQKL